MIQISLHVDDNIKSGNVHFTKHNKKQHCRIKSPSYGSIPFKPNLKYLLLLSLTHDVLPTTYFEY